MTKTQATHFICSGPEILQQLQLPEPYQLDGSPDNLVPVAALDNFDNQLLRRNQVLLQSSEELFLLDDAGLLTAPLASKQMGFMPDSIPDALKPALGGVEALRRLVPVAHFALQHCSSRLLDDDRKTCARLTLLQIDSTAGVHVNWIELHPLRGYDSAFKLLRQQFLDLGAKEHAEPVQLLQQLGYSDSGYQNNPPVALSPDLTAQVAARRMVSTFLGVARQNEQGIIDDLDTEFLHDYRVSLRRVRSLISLFKGVWDDATEQQLKQRFSAIMRITNRLRDLDVYLLDQASYYTLLPVSMHPGIDDIFASFARERAQQSRELAAHLRSEAYKREITALEQLFEGDNDSMAVGERAEDNVLEYGCRLITKRYRKVCRIASKIDEDTPDEEVHELRLQCKKLRYLLDFFSPLLDRKQVRVLIKSLKSLQDNLGRFNDYSSQQLSLQAFLDEQLASRKQVGPKMIEAIGALIILKHQLQLKERALVMGSFEAFNSAKTRQIIENLCRESTKPSGV